MITGLLFGSCCVEHLHSSEIHVNYVPPVNAKNVEVYATEQVNSPYIIVGDVHTRINAVGDGSASVKYLKKEAAEMGADGIINLRLEVGSGILANAVTASGTAVKFYELTDK